jgi:3',5'-cyclic AMP phosphodiesterase CpdA
MDPGHILSRIVTANDVHFGEFECGKFGGQPAQFLADPADPYPLIMNRAVVAEALDVNPDLCVVKGDLTNDGSPADERAFLDTYAPFGDRLLYVRGNHDSYDGRVFADWPVQVRDLAGIRVVLLDTARSHQSGGCISDEQLEATIAAVRSATTPTMIMGHHPLQVAQHTAPNDGVCDEDSERFLAAVAPERSVIGYFAGHTHRNHLRVVDGLPLVEVAAVKDFPGAWAEYVVGDRGITQQVHRVREPKAFAWAETTKSMFGGWYESYAMGELSDRSHFFPLER